MNKEAQAFLKQAIKDGKVFTTPIHSLGPIGTTAIKQVTPDKPFGKPIKKTALLHNITGKGGNL